MAGYTHFRAKHRLQLSQRKNNIAARMREKVALPDSLSEGLSCLSSLDWAPQRRGGLFRVLPSILQSLLHSRKSRIEMLVPGREDQLLMEIKV